MGHAVASMWGEGTLGCFPESYLATWKDGCREAGGRAERQGPHEHLDAMSKLFLLDVLDLI